jgi:acetyl-CoA carboxylase biotin carboxylase subunit
MGIVTVACYDESDRGSLHVLLADESVRLPDAQGYSNKEEMIKLALSRQADAIHPGYGFLADSPEFAESCAKANLGFIGLNADLLKTCVSKFEMLKLARECRIRTLEHSEQAFDPDALEEIRESAEQIGYPVYVKAVKGTGMRASRLLRDQSELRRSVELSSREGELVFADKRVYLEKSDLRSRTIQLHFLADGADRIVILGTVDVSMHRHNTRFLCESPAPGLNCEAELIALSESLIKRLAYRGLGTLEFALDQDGNLYLRELQARIAIEHSVIELCRGIDLIQEQIKLAAGEPLSQTVRAASGVAMQCRIYAQDLMRHSLPNPGILKRFRLPGGPHVRVDAYGYGGCIPAKFDPLLATISCWGESRQECISRLQRALRDTAITGVKTNQARIQSILKDSDFAAGQYNIGTAMEFHQDCFSQDSNDLLAAVAAIAYAAGTQRAGISKPERFIGGWHASSRLIN